VVFFVLIELNCTELGIAWRAMSLGTLPPLFTVRDRQPVADEIAAARLMTMGLIDPCGVARPDLDQAMTAFAQAAVEVDLRGTTRTGTGVRAAVAVLDDAAYLAVVVRGHVRFSRVPAEAALAALVAVLPAEPPARGTAISLPLADVDAAVTAALESGTPPADPDRVLVAGLTARGIAEPDAWLFTTLTGGLRSRLTEFGITCRDRTGARRRCTGTAHVIDTRRGRAVRYIRGGYLVTAPADSHTVVHALADLRDAELDRLGGNRLG
jgi:ESX secretion-associated protein EspG